MARSWHRTLGVVAVVAFAAVGCSDSDGDAGEVVDTGAVVVTGAEPVATAPDALPTDSSPAATDAPTPVVELGDGPITLISLGDSLTAGDGDDSGMGYVSRLAQAIAAVPGREDLSVVNLGSSGWDSTTMVEGQLGPAVDEVRAAVDEGRNALVTVLIGSNDLWYLYEYGTPSGTTAAEEDTAADVFRTNLERTVTELLAAGAVVVVGLPDDQSVRPAVVDIDELHLYLPSVTVEEVQQMSAMAVRFDQIAAEVAATHGLPTVDTNGPYWAEDATMADDGVHPNGEGYTVLADQWFAVIQPLL